MSIHYRNENIRRLLTEGFSAEELREMAYDEPAFRPVYDQLSSSVGKGQIVHNLIEFAERKDFLDILLERAKVKNPAKYAAYQPYHRDTWGTGTSPKPHLTLKISAAAPKRLKNLRP